MNHVLLCILLQGKSNIFVCTKEPNSLVHDDKDSGDDNPNSPYSLMIGEHLYCQVTKSDNTLGHCLIQLLALY